MKQFDIFNILSYTMNYDKKMEVMIIKDSKIREPIQKRAIEKKERILKCGFKLMCEKGYHNVDCIEIAESAKVSTGTVYQYFKDKKDIFLQGLKKYSESTLFPILEYKDKKIELKDVSTFIEKIIEHNIKIHNMSQAAHEEIMSMRHSDPEVNKIFQEYEIEATNVLVNILQNSNLKTDNIYEKSHLIITWIDDLCHEVIYHKHDNYDYKKMTELVTNSIVNLLK